MNDRFRKRTLVASAIEESSGELAVNVLGVFHGGAVWEAAVADDQVDADGE